MAADQVNEKMIVEQNMNGTCSFPADDDSSFPSDNYAGEDEEKAIPWRNVVQNTWLMIMGMDIVNTINGKSMIVYLKDRNSTLIKAWTTKIIEKNIMLKNTSKDEKKKLFIMSLGMKTAEKTKRMYYNFKITT